MEKGGFAVNYKGMNDDMRCKGFQYEVGGEYETDEAKVCECGFHACEYPLDVFKYYPPAGNRFFAVEQSGTMSKSDEDTKVASSRIKIREELSISGIVKDAVEYTQERCTKKGEKATGYKDATYATGNYGAASATGTMGAASATGDEGAAYATGNLGAAYATGNLGAASATGEQGAASCTGDYSAASCTGDYSAASATGYYSAASATGEQAASATGEQGAASATGYYSAASATGEQGAASATGYCGAASATGKASAAMACGIEGKAMGSLGCAIFLVERGEYNGETYPIVSVKAVIVDGENVKPGVWYTLRNGELVEA